MAQLGAAEQARFPTAPSPTSIPTVAGGYRSTTLAMSATRSLGSTRSRSRRRRPGPCAQAAPQRARKFKIVPVGFITNQLRSERDQARGGRTDPSAVGFVTMLLADIEGSTALVHCLGDHYGELLERVRSLLRDCSTARRLRRRDRRADEFFAVFEQPAAADHGRDRAAPARTRASAGDEVCVSGSGSAATRRWPRRTTSAWPCTRRICGGARRADRRVGDFRTALGVPRRTGCGSGGWAPRCGLPDKVSSTRWRRTSPPALQSLR